ncbi:glycoside hydrolase family 37 protein [Artomyces pyxidatus]|uniref:Glycoside hydrolase family 37 protein n=1 Tax=Artomyces pyxidatus TaxID=48021 RepID=A0ACB8SX23_9AGAM|nr:glycoside hydrolase family 37 protein [Artomyces pyxidatus]
MLSKWAAAAAAAGCWAQGARGVPQASTATSPPTGVDTGVPTITEQTSVASPTASLSSTLPSQVPLPPAQAWCPSEIFCAGPVLQTVNIAQLWTDPKTFVDKPTDSSPQSVLSAFSSINSTNATEGSVLTFVDSNFRGEGLELEAQALPNFNPNPPFLNNVTDPLLKGFSSIVNGYWTQLIRGTNASTLCNGQACESTLIPLNHTFVVPGGRFREQYYWDSYWIIEGLIQSQLFDIANATLQNFMDEIETRGFIPNGGRIYYLNRSQPPLFIWMLSNYVAASSDTSILTRALPLAERELAWWRDNRSLNVTSPFTNQTYLLSRYAVTNSAPRPESYLTDYLTANDPALKTPLNESQRADLYSELASGAETGWDYSTRFVSQPLAGGSANTNPALRSLNVKNHIPVDLNSILYKANTILAELYVLGDTKNQSAATQHEATAASIRAGILDLFWDSSKLAFYDFNLTSNTRNSIFTAATFYPLWAGIIPDEILSSASNAFGFFSSINMVLHRYNGTFPTTFIESGLQWDAPNAWPPHQYIALQALRALPANISAGSIPTPPSNSSTFALVPSGQLALSEDSLPGQPLTGTKNVTRTGPDADINGLNGTVVNGGNATVGEGWRDALARGLANRYFTSALCSWYSTGGSIPNLLPRLPDQALNVSGSINNTGNMFEKFSIQDIDIGGHGGEYTVQAGFGWTNGVVLWVASNFGPQLVAPTCPNPELEASTSSSGSSKNGAGSLTWNVWLLVGSALLMALQISSL